MFLQVSFCPQGGRVSASVHAGMPYPPDQADPPGTRQTPPQDQADPPGTRQTPPGPGRHPPDQAEHPPGPGRHPPWDQADTPPGTRQTPPPGPGRHPPPPEADTSIRATSCRYASYWNAFLFTFAITCYITITIYQTRHLPKILGLQRFFFVSETLLT